MDFTWVTDPLSNIYTDDPNTTLTLTASKAGDVTTSQFNPITTLGTDVVGWLAFGNNTAAIGIVDTITYSFTWTEAVSDFTFDILRISNNPIATESFTNFSVTPTVTDISNSTWDGVTLSSNPSSNGSAELVFAGPITSLTIDWVGSGTNGGVFIPASTGNDSVMFWTSPPPVPEPSAALLLGFGLAMGLVSARQRRE